LQVELSVSIVLSFMAWRILKFPQLPLLMALVAFVEI